MKKFIFTIREGMQVIIEAENLVKAQEEYEKVKEEASIMKVKIIKTPRTSTKKGLYDHLLELKDEGFFSETKTLSDIKNKLSQLALNYNITTFPPYLNKLVRERILVRSKKMIGKKEVWAYENEN